MLKAYTYYFISIPDIEPTTGMAIRLHKRIQVNIPVEPNDSVYCLKNIDSTIFPILWVDEGADIDQENIDKLKSMVTVPIMILEAVKWTMIVLGALLTLLGAVKVFLS